jgi:hypothetical protein
MDPNVNLVLEEMMKELRAEIKEGFAVHEAAFAKRLTRPWPVGRNQPVGWFIFF